MTGFEAGVSTVSTGGGDAVLADLELEDLPEILGPARRDWITENMDLFMFGSDAVIAAAEQAVPVFNYPGIYFLIWRDKVCYVGQGNPICLRIAAHVKEGRPVERVAVIVGLPPWAMTEIEHAYIRAWTPPWNAEETRCGALNEMQALLDRAEALDRVHVAEWVAPICTAAHARWKAWQLHVLGVQQADRL